MAAFNFGVVVGTSNFGCICNFREMKMSHLVFFSLEKRKETREKKTTREVKWKTRYERQVMRERGGRRKQMAKRGKEKGELEREKTGGG